MKSKKFLLAGALVVVFSAAMLINLARAEYDNENEGRGHSEGTPGKMMKEMKMSEKMKGEMENEDENKGSGNAMFSIQPNGNVTIGNASLVSMSGQTLNVKVFGLGLTVNTTTSTKIVGVDNSATSTAMQAGDLLDIKGSIDSNSGVITASAVRDRSREAQNNQGILQKIQALFEQIKQLQEQLRGAIR